MIVYHGTADYVLPLIQQTAHIVRRRTYVKRKSFCTTTERSVAELFAIRKTGTEAFLAGRITGVVLEYELCGSEPHDWQRVRDPRCMVEEHEVAVYNVRRLVLAAVWRYDKDWHREPVRSVYGETAAGAPKRRSATQGPTPRVRVRVGA